MTDAPFTSTTLDENAVFEPDRVKYGIIKPAVFLGGVALCFVPLLFLIGVPMMIASVFIRPAKGVFRGACPHCGTDLIVPRQVIGTNCPACAKRIIVKPDGFQAVV